MRVKNLIGRRTATPPRDAVTPSHQILLRGGYVRQMGQGIFSLLPLGQRSRAKIEQILREEMDAIEGQEILMPVVTPAELWQQSGRYQAIGGELVRFDDRSGHPHVLNMTNEETVVDVVKANVDSYRQLPFMVYQVQTKFRDEPRSRAGLIRVREFIMKDGYSFHRTPEDLEAYYDRVLEAYKRIFKRCGLTQTVDISSDTGMMGGRLAHEFMFLSPHGEDTLLLCDSCGYRANREVVPTKRSFKPAQDEPLAEMQRVDTPGTKTIEEVATFLKTTADRCCKAVLFMTRDDKPVAGFVRGDMDLNQAKLRNAIMAAELRPMREDEFAQFGSVAGYFGPVGLDPEVWTMRFDRSILETPNLVIGGNEKDVHVTGFNLARDLEGAEVIDLADVVEGDPCPECGTGLRQSRGIEVGNIFQLGTKYSESMELLYTEEDGVAKHPTMGCYGIGVGRTLACVIEEHHDENGPMWPATVAPFTVQVCCIQAKKQPVREAGDALYQALLKAGVDVILDDREVGAGFMFADADLIGAPVRVIISPRNLKNDAVEMKYRVANADESLPTSLPIAEAAETIPKLVKKLVDTIEG